MDSINQKQLPADAHTSHDVFPARLPWQGMVKLYNLGSSFVITTQFAIQRQVT